ncbi:MAG: hypothetical protein AB7N99_08145 [Simkaniaceae bacterium]
MAVHNDGRGGWSCWSWCCGGGEEDQKVVNESSRLLHDGPPKDQRDMGRTEDVKQPSTYQPPPVVHEEHKDEADGRRTPPMGVQGSPPGSPGTLSAPGTPDSAFGVTTFTTKEGVASPAKKNPNDGENQ